MNANKTHISLETAKLLKDCGVESEYAYVDCEKEAIHIEHWQTIDGEWGSCRTIVFEKPEEYDIFNIEGVYAYTWQEILWENAEKFFGEEIKYGKIDEKSQMQRIDVNNHEHEYTILLLLQQKKYEEADDFFRKKCVLID